MHKPTYFILNGGNEIKDRIYPSNPWYEECYEKFFAMAKGAEKWIAVYSMYSEKGAPSLPQAEK